MKFLYFYKFGPLQIPLDCSREQEARLFRKQRFYFFFIFFISYLLGTQNMQKSIFQKNQIKYL